MDWHHDWFGITQWHRDWFGVTADASLPPSGPDGVATFALALENGYTVSYRWVTDIIPTASGKEQRISINDHPKERYSGRVVLFGSAPASLRAQMATQAAQGATFQLGLPHEELSIRATHSTTTIYVHSTATRDWMNPGQRVSVVRRDPDTDEYESVDATIQSVTSNSIVLDVNPGTVGDIGGVVMPLMPVLLEPEQSFPRYPTRAERWDIQARAVSFDFARELATLALGPLTSHVGLDAATVTARVPSSGITLAMQDVGGVAPNGLISDGIGNVLIAFDADVTTITQIYDLLSTSVYLAPTGTWGAGTLTAGDAFGATALTGGTTAGPMGTGATVTQYASRAIWDRKLDNDGEVTDSVHAMTEIVEYTGVPQAVARADYANWGRAVGFQGTHGDDWQWWKAFMYAVKGRQKAFWLPTWRDDLPFVSKSTNTITVEADVGAWWPAQRQHVQIEETSGTLTRREITAAVNNGNGTWTLTIGVTIATALVERVSWIELARWTQDGTSVTFDEYGFEMEMSATVVQQ